MKVYAMKMQSRTKQSSNLIVDSTAWTRFKKTTFKIRAGLLVFYTWIKHQVEEGEQIHTQVEARKEESRQKFYRYGNFPRIF